MSELANTLAQDLPMQEAATFATAFDAETGRAMLALYRSADIASMREWGTDAEAAAARPGLVFAGSNDPYTGGVELGRRGVCRTGARFEQLDGVGHWWMLDDPVGTAAILEEFWSP